VLAILLLAAILYFLKGQLPEIASLYTMQVFVTLFAFVFLMGILISWISTFVAVRRYLRMKEDDLYY